MKILHLILAVLMLVPLTIYSKDKETEKEPSPISDKDARAVRDIQNNILKSQLELSQLQMQLMQQLNSLQLQYNQKLTELKKTYNCGECSLDNDLKWIPKQVEPVQLNLSKP